MRIRHAHWVVAMFLAVSLGGERVQASAFTIDDWLLNTGLGLPQGPEYCFFNTVQNPFQDSHGVVVANSTANTAYDFSWMINSAGFNIESSHEVEGLESGSVFAASSGNIWITPTEDLVLSMDAAYSYQFSAIAQIATLSVAVCYAGQPGCIFVETERAVGFPGEPSAGTLEIHDEILLPANETWVLSYSQSVHTATSNAGLIVTGSGYVTLTITPEPGVAAIAGLGALVVAWRRSGGRGKVV